VTGKYLDVLYIDVHIYRIIFSTNYFLTIQHCSACYVFYFFPFLCTCKTKYEKEAYAIVECKNYLELIT